MGLEPPLEAANGRYSPLARRGWFVDMELSSSLLDRTIDHGLGRGIVLARLITGKASGSSSPCEHLAQGHQVGMWGVGGRGTHRLVESGATCEATDVTTFLPPSLFTHLRSMLLLLLSRSVERIFLLLSRERFCSSLDALPPPSSRLRVPCACFRHYPCEYPNPPPPHPQPRSLSLSGSRTHPDGMFVGLPR